MVTDRTSVMISLAALASMVVTLFAMAPDRRAATPAVPACPAGTSPMVRVELIFGMSRKERPEITEEEWRAFLEQEVTPRFPDGLTVIMGQGQWRNATETIVRETSRMLLVFVPPSPEIDANVDALRDAWRRRHEQQSVLKAVAASCVAF